jgi:septation ring formation regulator EzrA
MANQAKVGSLDSIKLFRTSLIIFIERMTNALDEVGDEVKRTRNWILDEQVNYWRSLKRQWEKKLDQAEQELYSSRLSTLHNTNTEAQMNVRRAAQKVDEINGKIRTVQKWARDYDSIVEPLARRLDTYRDLLSTKYPKAIFQIDKTIETLESYAEISKGEVIKAPESDPDGNN